MTNGWYEAVSPRTSLTQGDVIFDCPLLAWGPAISAWLGGPEAEFLKAASHTTRADVVVMTQACDLEHDKLADVVLCPHLPVSEYRQYWEEEMRARSQNPTQKAWRNHFGDIREGYLWNLAVLNSGDVDGLVTEHRIVDFHEVFTSPKTFLEALIVRRGQPRLRLLPPYREHLSQAFARFFMRVGLPVEVEPLG